MFALKLGIVIGLVTEILRKLVKRHARYQRFVRESKAGYACDFVVDAVVLPSPYASSFGGFVELTTSLWFGLGGIVGSAFESWQARRHRVTRSADDAAIPADMSTTSLVGGGLIAGDSLAALSLGILGLIKAMT
jgi:hypothetical protein